MIRLTNTVGKTIAQQRVTREKTLSPERFLAIIRLRGSVVSQK